ncbi:MAG: cytochrome b [Steroidobacteraceae bacterium]
MSQPNLHSQEFLRYNKLAIAFHWITAALFVVLYVAVYYRIWFTHRGEPENITAIRYHTFAGLLVGLIAILRLVWHRVAPPPVFAPGPPIEHVAAKAMHYVLYAFMILMPATGYLGLHAPLGFFDIPKFPDTALYHWLVTERLGLTWEQFEAPLDWIHHKMGAFVIWVLIFIHASAALYHHYARHDDVLSRMLPTIRPRRLSK